MRAGFDGSFKDHKGCLGYWIMNEHGALLAEVSEVVKRVKSPMHAELLAFTNLLNIIRHFKSVEIVIEGDDQALINILNGSHKPGRGNKIREMLLQVRSKLRELPFVTLKWIPRDRNSRADNLAFLANRTIRRENRDRVRFKRMDWVESPYPIQ